MADQVITKQELIDAQKDAQTLEDAVNGEPGKLIKSRTGREFYSLASVPQINTMTREEVTAVVAPKANKVDVDTALSNLSTTANKYYSTKAAAEADIANIALNQSVTIGEEANSGLWEKKTAGATSLTKSPYDPLSLSKAYSDRDKFAPYYAKNDFESGYLETFFDSHKTVNQYVPARYTADGFAQIAAGTFTKKIPLSTGLSIRFKTKYSTFEPLMILGLTDSPNGFVSANNIGIATGSSLTNAFHFRLPGGYQPVASTLLKTDLNNNVFHMELIIQGGALTLNRYTSDFGSVVETFTQPVDRSSYESYKYLILYTQTTTWFSLIEINHFNEKTQIETNSINPNWFDSAASYMLEDWSRRTTTSASALQSLGRDGQLASKANIIEMDILVDTSNTTDGFLIGFGNAATSSDRIAIGYEPASTYRGLVFLSGTVSGAAFNRIVPIEQLTNGVYKLVLSKSDTYYRYQVYKPDGVLMVDGEYQSDLATSLQLYISGKYTTASKTLVKDVRLKQGVSLEVKPKQSTGFKDLTGRNLIQEQFGGEGNDWCFVYTPPNYSTSGKAHKFVILNHGNGWTVSSNPSTANFSSKTQFGVDTQNGGTYLDTGRADYVQYSSPLIEALLAQGYVVCGATNYADNLYGNNNCRNAVVDFYNYMRKNYNVTDRCHMIGASNGAMTTLNACHLMGASKVASIALLYPLASLFDHYLAYSGHRDAIRSAYGVSGNTYANLAALKAEPAFYTHCPVHHYIVGDDLTDQQVRTYPFPPIIMYSSTGDTVTNAASNGEKLKDLCDRSSLVCQYTDIDPTGALGYEHGDWHHFKEVEIVNFFLTNK